MKKHLVSCIAIVTFGLMFAWLALSVFKAGDVFKYTGYDVLDAGTNKLFSDAQNAQYIFLLLSVISGALAVAVALLASAQTCGVLKVKFNFKMVVVCVLCVTALFAVLSTICAFCIEGGDGMKIGAGLIIYPLWCVAGAVAAYLFRKA